MGGFLFYVKVHKVDRNLRRSAVRIFDKFKTEIGFFLCFNLECTRLSVVDMIVDQKQSS